MLILVVCHRSVPQLTFSVTLLVLGLTNEASNHESYGHDDVMKWKYFPRYWPIVRSHKGQWRRACEFTLICVWMNGWVNNREAGDLGRYRAHSDVTVMNELLYNHNKTNHNKACVA